MNSSDVLGLIAGEGRLPFLVAAGAKQAGLRVICIGLAETAEHGLADEVRDQLAAGLGCDLFPDDDQVRREPLRGQCSLDGVMIGDRDLIQADLLRTLNQRCRIIPGVSRGPGVGVEVNH